MILDSISGWKLNKTYFHLYLTLCGFEKKVHVSTSFDVVLQAVPMILHLITEIYHLFYSSKQT